MSCLCREQTLRKLTSSQTWARNSHKASRNVTPSCYGWLLSNRGIARKSLYKPQHSRTQLKKTFTQCRPTFCNASVYTEHALNCHQKSGETFAYLCFTYHFTSNKQYQETNVWSTDSEYSTQNHKYQFFISLEQKQTQ